MRLVEQRGDTLDERECFLSGLTEMEVVSQNSPMETQDVRRLGKFRKFLPNMGFVMLTPANFRAINDSPRNFSF